MTHYTTNYKDYAFKKGHKPEPRVETERERLLNERNISRTQVESSRGFASMSEDERREIASMGGKAAQASGRGHRFTPEEAREAARKGVLARGRIPKAPAPAASLNEAFGIGPAPAPAPTPAPPPIVPPPEVYRRTFYTYNGETMDANDWADKVGMKRTTLKSRLWCGWPFEEAITVGVRRRSPRKWVQLELPLGEDNPKVLQRMGHAVGAWRG